MGSLEHFHAHIARYGYSLDEIFAHADKVAPGATLVVTGSVAAGRGNRYSDLDILMVGGNAEACIRELVHFDHGFLVEHPTRLSTGQEVVVYTVTASSVAQYGERLAAGGRLLRNPDVDLKGVPLLSRDDYRLLDDIATGVVVRGDPAAYDALKQQLFLEDVPSYALLLALTFHLVQREDVIGLMERGAHEPALFMIRESIEFLSEAMLASVGIANNRAQWRLQLLDEAADRLGAASVEEVKRMLLKPESDPARVRAAVDALIAVSDREMAAMIMRVTHLMPAIMKLSQVQQFQTVPDAA